MQSQNLQEHREPQQQEELLDFLLHYATIQTSVGVQTSRIVLNTSRIAETYGYDTTMMMFQRNVAITLTPRAETTEKASRQSLPMTALTHHRTLPLNFYLNAELSRLSWYIHDNRPQIETLNDLLETTLKAPKINSWIILLLISIANAAFCLLFGGDTWGAVFVFVGTLLGFFARQELNKRHAYHYLTVLIAAFISSLTVGLGSLTGFSATPEIALGASVLYLIPGVPFINSMMDFLDGYMLNGTSRLINAIFIVISITVGLSGTLVLLNLNLL
ncbi:MAG: threonine/serine exporter family protein [Porphyromonadaceae bacterium]|nr:threonine/serine exporter family protein [Porphyromonadaceae bacterium]